jgi:RNA polymerase sigma-70 factor (ECF subfamily)
LRRLGALPSDIDDLTQEVFVVLDGRWHQLDLTRSLRPYLFGIALRLSAAQRRKRRRELAFGALELCDERPRPDEAFDSAQNSALLHAALACVPEPRRAVLVMHELEQVPVTEVARSLSISLFTVYSRLRKGRAELARAIRRMLACPQVLNMT